MSCCSNFSILTSQCIPLVIKYLSLSAQYDFGLCLGDLNYFFFKGAYSVLNTVQFYVYYCIENVVCYEING